jgi:hypothetical protein
MILDNLSSSSWMNDVSSDGSKMSAYDGTYLYLSSDYGQHWSIKDPSPLAFQCVQANADFSKFVAAEGSWASNDGFISTDSGDTWTDIFNESTVMQLGGCDISPNSQTIMFGDNSANLWLSNDGGNNFIDKGELFGGGNGNGNIKINDVNPDLACGTASGSLIGVIHTLDGGNTWSNNSLANGWQCYIGESTINPPASAPGRQRTSPITGGAVVTTPFLDSSFLQTSLTWRTIIIALIVISVAGIAYFALTRAN